MKKTVLLLIFLLACTACGETAVINSFGAGELSPLLEGRSDVRRYYSGCRTLENMVVLPHGGASKRPGTYYVASAKNSDSACRLIPFEFSVTQAYVIEMGNLYMRFYRDGGQITSDDEVYEISTPYETADLFEIQYVQSADTMFFAHPDYAPRKLTRTGHTSWTLDKIEFERGPFLDEYLCGEIEETEGPMNILSTDNDSVASETGTTRGTASGAVAYTNDDSTTTYWKRLTTETGTVLSDNVREWANFTINISIGNTVERIQKVQYSIGWTATVAATYSENSSTVTTAACSVKIGGAWTVIGTNTSTTSTIYGDWVGVTDIKLTLYIYISCKVAGEYTLEAGCTLYELQAWGAVAASTDCIYITPSNTDNYDQTLDAAAAVDLGGTANQVRLPSTDNEFLEGDYVIISNTTNYNGVYEVENKNDDDTFDIESAYNAETFAGTETVSSRVTLTASSALFNSNHVPSLWQLRHTIDGEEVTGSFLAPGNSDSITVHKDRKYDFSTHGVWTGTVTLQRSYDSGVSWKDVIPFHSENESNISYSDVEAIDDAIYQISAASMSGTCKYNLMARSFDVKGVAKVTSYIDTTHVRAEIKYDLGDTSATKFWSEGAFSPDEGYPACIAFYEERQVYAATNNMPQTIWMSQTDDWDNFLAGSYATDAIALTIVADQVNVIRWMLPQTALLVGTTGGEWKISATKEDEALSPGNINAKRQSNNGSSNIQAIAISNRILFVQRQGQKIRKMAYSFEMDNWIADDLTILSEHITGDGIISMSLMKNPYPVLWCVREDGELLGLTLEENQDVLGWHHHAFDGDVESAIVIPGASEDELWVEVERTIDGSTVRYIEQMQSFDWGSVQEDAFFVDSGLTFDGGSAVAVTGITQANPCVVTAAAHGFSDGDQVRFYDVNGMTYINGKVYTVESPATDTFSLRDKLNEVDIDSRGTVAHWKMDDNTDSTVVEDVYGHDGTSLLVTKDITIEGVIDSALSIETANRITIPDDNDFTFATAASDLPFSMAVWVKFTNIVSATNIIQKWDVDNGYEYLLRALGDDLDIFLNDNTNGGNLVYGVDDVLSLNTWHHIVVTYSGVEAASGLSMYLDGTAQSGTASTEGSYTRMVNTGSDLWIANTLHLYMDDLRIFGKVLASHEVTTLYNSGNGTSKPVGYCQYIDGGYVRQCENTFTTLGHLEAETVAVLQDGGDAGTQTVSSGTITLDDYYYVVSAGLPYTARLLPMKLELSGNPGSLFGETKRITEVTLRFYKTSGCDVGTSWTNYDSIVFRDTLDVLDEPTPLLTNDKTISFIGSFEEAGNIYIQNSLPMPFTVLAMKCKFELEE